MAAGGHGGAPLPSVVSLRTLTNPVRARLRRAPADSPQEGRELTKRITVRSLAAPAAAVVLALTGTATAQAQSARPDSINDGSFDTNSGASVVTGTVWFDSATSFHLTTVKLTDKICGDSRAAEFRVIVVDMDGRTIDFGWHSLVNDCASPITWSNLPGSI